MKKLLPAIISSGLMLPTISHGLGLTDIKVTSALNQPFRATVQLTDLANISLGDIRVVQASSQQVEDAGLDDTEFNVSLTYNITRNKFGVPVIEISSKNPITDPMLQFMVDVRWPSGQFFRTYTVLLDPPAYKVVKRSEPLRYSEKKRPARVEKKIRNAAKVARNVSSDDLVQSESTLASADLIDITPDEEAVIATRHEQTAAPSKKTAVALSMNPPREKNGVRQYGPVQRHENLWRIASKFAGKNNVSQEQMMVAIMKANPDAFMNDNMNGLRLGANLVIPSAATARAQSTSKAGQMIAEHAMSWRDHRGSSTTALAKNTAKKPQVERSATPHEDESEIADNSDNETPAPKVTDNSKLNLDLDQDNVKKVLSEADKSATSAGAQGNSESDEIATNDDVLTSELDNVNLDLSKKSVADAQDSDKIDFKPEKAQATHVASTQAAPVQPVAKPVELNHEKPLVHTAATLAAVKPIVQHTATDAAHVELKQHVQPAAVKPAVAATQVAHIKTANHVASMSAPINQSGAIKLNMAEKTYHGIEKPQEAPAISRSAADDEKSLKAELAMSTSPADRAAEANQELRNQVTEMNTHTQHLQTEVAKRDKEMKALRQQLVQVTRVTRDKSYAEKVDNNAVDVLPNAGAQASSVAVEESNNSSMKFLIALVALLGAGGAFFWLGREKLEEFTNEYIARKENERDERDGKNNYRAQSASQQKQAFFEQEAQKNVDAVIADDSAAAESIPVEGIVGKAKRSTGKRRVNQTFTNDQSLADLSDDGKDVVATKLDLATAFISMEEFNDARALLNEVIAQGTPEQRAEAEKLIATLHQ